MFSLFARGRSSHKHAIFTPSEGPIRVDEARFAAWSRALGDFRQSADPPPSPRMHRGMLPDVDWSNAVPMPRRRSLLRLLAGALAARLVPLANLGDSGPRAIGDDEGVPQSGAPMAMVSRRSMLAIADQPTRRAA